MKSRVLGNLCGVAAGLALSGGAATAQLVNTGIETDLAIVGEGYFVLQAGPEFRLTRYCRLRLDPQGVFHTEAGSSLMGYPGHSPELGRLVFGWTLPAGNPGATLSGMRIQTNGAMVATFTNGEECLSGRIPIWLPPNPTALRRVGDAELIDPAMKDDWAARLTQPGNGGAGRIQAGSYELPVPSLQITRFNRAGTGIDPGPIVRTGIQTHLALEGPGLLQLRDPVSGSHFLTRSAALRADPSGFLVTPERGYRLQGDVTTSAINGGAELPTVLGDVQIDLGVPPQEMAPTDDHSSGLASFSLERDGAILVRRTDGVQYLRGRILVRHITRPDLLTPVDRRLYELPPEAHDSVGPFREPTGLSSGALDLNHLDAAALALWRKQLMGLQGPVMRMPGTDFLAISGPGYFVLRQPESGQMIFTRLGFFTWSAAGYLQSTGGGRVQGFAPGGRELMDIRLAARADNPITAHDIDPEGMLRARHADGSLTVLGQLALAPGWPVLDLVEVGTYHYAAPWNPGSPEPVSPSTSNGVGRIVHQAIEQLWENLRDIPEALPESGLHVGTWGGAGRQMFLEFTEDIARWPAAGSLRHQQMEFPIAGYQLLPDTSISAHGFFRLVVADSP